MIRDNVRDIREAKGITGSHVAEKIGFTPQGYRHIEKGNSRLQAETLKSIAVVLEEPVSVFFDREQTESVLQRIGGEVKCTK